MHSLGAPIKALAGTIAHGGLRVAIAIQPGNDHIRNLLNKPFKVHKAVIGK